MTSFTLIPDQCDQAAGLRRLFGARATQRVAFIASRETRGSSVLVARTAAALAVMGHSVVIADENSSPDNTACAFGMVGRHDLLDCIQGKQATQQAELSVAPQVRLMPAARAAHYLRSLAATQTPRWKAVMEELQSDAGFMLIDAAQKNGPHMSALVQETPHWVLVVAAQGAAITHAYVLLKSLINDYGRNQFYVAITRAHNADEARAIFGNMQRMAQDNLGAELKFFASVMTPVTEHFADALLTRLPVADTARLPEVTEAADSLDALATDEFISTLSGDLADLDLSVAHEAQPSAQTDAHALTC